MCEKLAELRRAMALFSSSFDAALVPPGALAQVLADASAIERVASAVASMAAAQMATRSSATSARQVAEALARASGTSVAEARRAVEAGRAMAAQPELAAAALAGELSRQQAALVACAAQANPASTALLLSTARTASLSELAEQAGRARAAATDLDAQRRYVAAHRGLRQWADTSGTWHLHAVGLPEHGARVMAAIGPFADKAFEAARKEGRRERPDAYSFDGLVGLADAGGGGGASYEVMVRIDHDALVRGYAIEGETCELPGFGTVTPEVVADMVSSGDPFLKAIVTKGKDVIGVAHLGRRPNAYQRSALDWLFPTCAAEGCGVRAAHLQTDHRLEWAKAHFTMVDLLDRLCPHDHALKTYQGWSLVEGTGKRAFVPPDDPRHPRHRDHPSDPSHRAGTGPPGNGPPGTGPPGTGPPGTEPPSTGPPGAEAPRTEPPRTEPPRTEPTGH